MSALIQLRALLSVCLSKVVTAHNKPNASLLLLFGAARKAACHYYTPVRNNNKRNSNNISAGRQSKRAYRAHLVPLIWRRLPPSLRSALLFLVTAMLLIKGNLSLARSNANQFRHIAPACQQEMRFSGLSLPGPQ